VLVDKHHQQSFKFSCETFSLRLMTVCFHKILSKIWRFAFY